MLGENRHQCLIETLAVLAAFHTFERAACQLLIHLLFEPIVAGIWLSLQDAANVASCQLVGYIKTGGSPGDGTLDELFARDVGCLVAQIMQHFVVSCKKIAVAVVLEI